MEPVIRHSSPYGGDYISLPRASTTVFKKGWLVSLESNAAVNMDAATEDATFVGVAWTNHDSGDTHNLTATTKCILDIDNASATFDTGNGVKYNAGSATVVYKVEDDAGANTIGHANKVYTSAVTRMQIRIDVPQLQKLFEVNA